MFRWLTRSHCPASRLPRPQGCLSLERLEDRDCLNNPGLMILGFSATALPGQVGQVSGTVVDDDPASVQLSFSGGVNGTTSAGASGNFSFSMPNASLGTVIAYAVDDENDQCAASTTLEKPLPVVSLQITYGPERSVTLSGSVSDLDPSGRTVKFTGVVTGSATTDANGNFSYTHDASALGAVSATTTDLWGQTSNPATVNVSVAPPKIYGFTATRIPGITNTWTFSGDVNAQSAPFMTVTFSGLPELNGQTTTVAADDSFSDTFNLAVGESGSVTATVTDWWGQTGAASVLVLQ
jgi:hypothetical protein